ncbi:MAG: tetratricopeptide repeat protein [Planctomycetota bacterium]
MSRLAAVALVALSLAGGLLAQDAVLETARARLLAGDAEGARDILRAEIIRRPEAATGETWRLLGLASEAMGQEESAERAFHRALGAGVGDVEVVSRLARRAAEKEQWGQVAQMLRLWIAADPRDETLARALGPALERSGRSDEAYRHYVVLFVNDADPRDSAIGAARCARALGRAEEELVWWTLAARFGADTSRERAFRAELLARFGRHEEAATLRAADAPAVAPDGLAARRARAIAAAGSPEEEGAWEAYFAAGGDEAAAHRRYGRLLVRAGHGERARPHLVAAAATESKDLAILVESRRSGATATCPGRCSVGWSRRRAQPCPRPASPTPLSDPVRIRTSAVTLDRTHRHLIQRRIRERGGLHPS